MNSNNKWDIELLKTEELLKRLKIGKTKLFELIGKDTLIPGIHYFRNGRVLRFVWSADLIKALHDSSSAKLSSSLKPKTTNRPQNRNYARSQVNLEY